MATTELTHEEIMQVEQKPKPAGLDEFSWRAVACGMVVAVLMGASYPYIVLKLGFGPNISIVSAFLGYIAIAVVCRAKNYNRWENNIVQTAGTSAGQTAFMCVLLAAFDLLNKETELGFHFDISPLQSSLWLTVAGVMGVLAAVPFRRYYIEEEKLTFPDGVAVAETLVILDSDHSHAKGAARTMMAGGLVSAVIAWFQTGFPKVLPESWFFGEFGQKLKMGLGWSLLSLGSGMIVGIRVGLSMGLGMLISWVYFPQFLFDHGIITEVSYKVVTRWVMWPATGLLVSSGLTALVVHWRSLSRSFKVLTGKRSGPVSDEFPLRWVIIGFLTCAALLCAIQKFNLNIPVWLTILSILFSLPMMLVGLRVLGETNWGPISAMSNMMQAVFAVISPGNVPVNMISSGTTGTIAVESEAIMQDYKAAHLIGSNNRLLTYAQLLAVPVGAVTVSYFYAILRNQYGIGGDGGLSAPIAVKWAGFAVLLTKGLSALPEGCLTALWVSVVVGIVLTAFDATRFKKYMPSPTGVGIGMLVPGVAISMMVLGSILEYVWRKMSPHGAKRHLVPLASGFIAGEALVAVIIPILVLLGLLAV